MILGHQFLVLPLDFSPEARSTVRERNSEDGREAARSMSSVASRVWNGRLAFAVLPAFTLLMLTAALLAPSAARAQGALEFSRSYITPFPPGDRYRLMVFGDSLGEGIWSGLYRAFEKDQNMEVIKKARGGSGLARISQFDWNAELANILKDEQVHIAVVLMGINDTQAIQVKGASLKLGSEQWSATYGQRMEDFIRKLKAKGTAVYWVGLPIMRSPDQNVDVEMLNELFRERAFVNGVKYIDTWNGFADQFGRYSPYGPDVSGQVKRLRADDGIHFTERGNEKLAHFVEREIRRDLNFAKNERNIPLAGNEDEQNKAVGRTALGRLQGRGAAGAEKPRTDGSTVAKTGSGAPKPADAVTVGGVEIKRPPLPEAALNLAQSLAPQAPSNALPDGETIASDLGEGLTALATISPVNDSSSLTAKRGVPLTERGYYKVLIKGEQLKPKPGRADDFAWPKGQPAAQAKAPEAAAAP